MFLLSHKSFVVDFLLGFKFASIKSVTSIYNWGWVRVLSCATGCWWFLCSIKNTVFIEDLVFSVMWLKHPPFVTSIQARSQLGGWREYSSLPDPNKLMLILLTIENMSFLMLCFKLPAWRILHFTLFLCRNWVPYHNFWFDKMKQLVAIFIKSLVSEHFSMEVETFNIAVALNLVWFDATASLGFPCHTFGYLPTQNPSL